ncbi:MULTISPECIES: tyrosine-type recombinase/integrase [Sphingobium]|uniref:tyrosine-type recombinase/integrase n=1 Tax=Sphingobium sp. MI1205 TaxID=407020 RepID=UPI00077059E5|nr:integrase family protein [Sphingobium sp. MI1205]AMK18324.1 putative integrase [Sphingobium sp. MI1205]
MPKLTKTVVDKADPRDRQCTVWCSDLKGFGVFVLPSGTRTYFVHYRNANNVRGRMKLGRRGTVTTEQARTLAIQALADVAKGNDPHEGRNSARKAISVKELCELYMAELEAGRILGKGGRFKKQDHRSWPDYRHIIPLLGSKRVTHVTKADVTAMMKDIMAGKTRANEKTKKLRGKSIVRGGLAAASRTVGLLGGIFSYARDELGIIEINPAHGVRQPKSVVRKRRLNQDEYRTLGRILAKAIEDEHYTRAVDIIRLIAMSGCRRNEIIEIRKSEIDTVGSTFRLEGTKEDRSVRPMGLPAVEYFDERDMTGRNSYLFPGERNTDGPFGSFPRHWEKIFAGTELADLTAHVLRHSFANDLGSTEITSRRCSVMRRARSRAAMCICSMRPSSWPPTRCRTTFRRCSTEPSCLIPTMRSIAARGRPRWSGF